MPGIITHHKILTESIRYLSKRKKKSYLLRTLESLFSSTEFYSAALFGAIGPNIFDYYPQRKKGVYTGQISYFLHNGDCGPLVARMIDTIREYPDQNTNWASTQRAYLYGFISHIIADIYIHPYVFFNSGFVNESDNKQPHYFREQNLLFQYSIDNYFMYHSEDAGEMGPKCIDEMFPFKCKKGLLRFNKPVKALLLQSIHAVYPDVYNKIVFYCPNKDAINYTEVFSVLDLIPFFLKKTYKLKMTTKQRFKDFLLKLNEYSFLQNDFFVFYPDRKRLKKDILNEHRSRWEYPTNKTGFHYDSLENLVVKTSEKIIQAWEAIEASLFEKNKKNNFFDLFVNMYTGDGSNRYEEMKTCNPIRIKY